MSARTLVGIVLAGFIGLIAAGPSLLSTAWLNGKVRSYLNENLQDGTAVDFGELDIAWSTGIRLTDQCRSVELFERALTIAGQLSSPGATFVGKLLMGPGFDEIVARTKAVFRRTKTVKPSASRKASVEIYLVGMDCRQTTIPACEA